MRWTWRTRPYPLGRPVFVTGRRYLELRRSRSMPSSNVLRCEERDVGDRRTYGFAIVGCGIIGPVHARAIRELPNARLAVVVDKNRDRAQALAQTFGVNWEVELDRALARDDVDIVCVCVPS